jgi:hypothetical protein
MKVGMQCISPRGMFMGGSVSSTVATDRNSLSQTLKRTLPPHRIRNSLGNTILPLKPLAPTVLAPRRITTTTSSPACHPRMRVVPTVHMRRMAAHRNLIIFQISRPGASRRSHVFRRVAASGAAQLGSDSEDVAQDVFEEGFEGWDGGCDEACVELGADPDC